MTVASLILRLQAFPPDSQACIRHEDGTGALVEHLRYEPQPGVTVIEPDPELQLRFAA
jgi:hypothetical protein